MKKILTILFASLSFSLVFSGCGFGDMQIPKEVKVRTDATYQFSVMSFDSEKEGSSLNISDYFDLEETLDEKTSESQDSPGINILKYNNGSRYQQFLIHMPLQEIEFDFSESFKDMDFSKAAQSFNIDKTIDIPDVSSLDKSEDLDLSGIVTALNTGLKCYGVTQTGDIDVTFITEPGVFEFDTVTYDVCKLKIDASESILNPSGGNISGSIALYKTGSAEPLATSTISNNKAELTVTNLIVEPTGLYLKYTTSNYLDYGKSFIVSIDENSAINNATGVTIDPSRFSVNDTEVTFPITLDQSLKEVKIKKGELGVEITTQPQGWTPGVISGYTITIGESVDPGITITESSVTTDNLNGQKLKAGDIKAAAHVNVVLNNATVVFTNPPKVHVFTDISEIDAEVAMSEEFKTTITKESDPGDLKKYVSEIEWEDEGVGFIITASNNLPDGNDMSLTLGSPELNVDAQTKTIEAGKDNQEIKYLCGNGKKTTFTDSTFIHVNGTLGLTEGPNSTTDAKTILVKGVKPGEQYSISLSVKPQFEWKKAKVKMPDGVDSEMHDSINTGINKKSLFETLGNDFAEKVNLASMPLYLFANVPENLKNDTMEFKGTIKASYKKENETTHAIEPVDSVQPVYLLGTETEAATIHTDKPLPKFEYDSKDPKVVTNNFGNDFIEFKDALNLYSPEGTLYLDYDIGMEGSGNDNIEITPSTIEGLQGKSSIKIDILLILTMEFKVTDTINIDMMELAKKKSEDLLGRSEPTDISDYEKYLEVVQSASVIVDNFRLPMDGAVSLSVDLYNEGSPKVNEVGNGGRYSIEVNPEKLLKTYPLVPDIQFVIGQQGKDSSFGLLRTMPISGKIKLNVRAKGDIQVYPFSEQN